MRVVVAALVIGLVSPKLALAHFKLTAPESLSVQNALGNPQKTAPCGQDDPSPVFTPTGALNTAVTGDMVEVTIEETVFHRGHYRIAIAADMAGLPPDPPVQAGTTACGTTTIEANPVLPLLADGVFLHTQKFTGPQTTQIQLPAGFTCNGCIMQITQFMNNHAAPCFYHHCATFTIADNPPPPIDAGVVVGDDAGVTGGSGAAGGCCSATGDRDAAWALSLVGLVMVARRRGRRSEA